MRAQILKPVSIIETETNSTRTSGKVRVLKEGEIYDITLNILDKDGTLDITVTNYVDGSIFKVNKLIGVTSFNSYKEFAYHYKMIESQAKNTIITKSSIDIC